MQRMKWPHARASITTKYLLSGLAICLISLLLVSIISYTISYNITATQSNLRIEQTAMKRATELDSWFKQQGGIVENMAQDIEITGNFNQNFLYRFLKNKHTLYLREVMDYYIGFEDPARQLVSGTDWAPPLDYDCRIRLWYRQARNAGKVVYSNPYIDAQTGKQVITIAKSLKKDGRIIGVLAADLDISKVTGIVRNYRLNERSYNFLLDNLGNILVHPNPKFQPAVDGLKNIYQIKGVNYSKLTETIQGEKMRPSMEASTDGRVVETRDYDGGWKYFILSKINSCGWVFGIAILRSEYRKPLQYLLYGFVLAFLASMVIGIAIMLKLIGGMIKPVQSLSATVKRFSTDNMNVRSDLQSGDELGELGQNFNQMADTIQEYSISLENKVAERTRELQEKNDKIMESIDYAERLQRAILPSLPLRLGIPTEDCFVVWKPRDQVGGDMYWCRSDPKYALLVVADCTGHGVPGALMTMALSSILDGLPRSMDGIRPSQILHLIHARLQETLGQSRADSTANDGADAAVCLFDKENRQLLFSGARLSLFVATQGRIAESKGSRCSVGYASQKALHYEDHPISWRPESIFYITTDGLLDQNRLPGKGGLGRTAFIDFLQSLGELPLQRQKEAVEALIAERLFQVEQRDDILVIGFRF